MQAPAVAAPGTDVVTGPGERRPRDRTPGAGVPRRPTIRDVADLAQVSQSTTSRALRNQGYVAAEVKDRVLRAATKLGYVPDEMARHLRQQVSRSIGVLVSDLRNSFYADLAAGATRAAKRAGYTVMLMDDRLQSQDEVDASEAFASMRVAGVVVTPLSATVTDFLVRQHIPAVEVDRQFAPESCDAVVVDNRVAAGKLTRHLVDLGHRRIALVVDETRWTTGRERLRGYEAALTEAGIAVDPTLQVATGWDVASARRAVAELLARPEPPTALFAANHLVAEGAWRAAAELGLAIPHDLSIVSFDEMPWMTMVSPSLTTVRQDGMALGEAAVLRLLERIQAPSAPIATLVLRAEVMVRGSSGPAPWGSSRSGAGRPVLTGPPVGAGAARGGAAGDGRP